MVALLLHRPRLGRLQRQNLRWSVDRHLRHRKSPIDSDEQSRHHQGLVTVNHQP